MHGRGEALIITEEQPVVAVVEAVVEDVELM